MQISRTFSEAADVLPKTIRGKLFSTINEFSRNPQSKGLHIEQLSNSDLCSARVDDNYRIIFKKPENTDVCFFLYVDTHEKAYRWAETHRLQINPALGSVELTSQTPKFVRDPETRAMLSRLSVLRDVQLSQMEIPEEYWPQLRTKVYNKTQLLGYRNLISEAAYHVLEYLLEGATLEEAMEFFQLESEDVSPTPIEEKNPFFADFDDNDLVKVGIPVEMISRVKLIKTEKELGVVAAGLSRTSAQSLYALHNGTSIEELQKTSFDAARVIGDTDFDKALSNPITLAEFAPVGSEEALQAILNHPAEKWRVFLHPLQQQLAKRNYNGAAQVIGGAGTGKTVVVVHRARYLASCCGEDEKILVTSFNKTLTADIKKRLNVICSSNELQHIDIVNVDKLAYDYARRMANVRIEYGRDVEAIWQKALQATGLTEKYSVSFCIDEFRDVIQEQNIALLSEYVEARRYGRGKQFDRKSREEFWKVIQKYLELCNQWKIADVDRAENILAELIKVDKSAQYKAVIVDECQDLRAPALRMLRALAGEQHENDMYLSGDSRQRIYNSRTSLAQCGIMINNRSRHLKLNYRTTKQIYDFAFKLQEKYNYDDMNGQSIDKVRNDCIFQGEAPKIHRFATEREEIEEMIRDIREKLAHGACDRDICIMLRSRQAMNRYVSELKNKGLEVLVCSNTQADDQDKPGVRIMTMHRSKGMEYTYVYLPCLTNAAIPPAKDVEKARVEENEQELIVKECNTLSVAITRAKIFVWLSYAGQPSMLLPEVE